ncbi:hypothetical protein BJ742DRAFT_739481 [Cladochytrium replicatum]|nr:hypothetical protein BJ742DRAFT_739481 [Cladochytrium replicatum]
MREIVVTCRFLLTFPWLECLRFQELLDFPTGPEATRCTHGGEGHDGEGARTGLSAGSDKSVPNGPDATNRANGGEGQDGEEQIVVRKQQGAYHRNIRNGPEATNHRGRGGHAGRSAHHEVGDNGYPPHAPNGFDATRHHRGGEGQDEVSMGASSFYERAPQPQTVYTPHYAFYAAATFCCQAFFCWRTNSIEKRASMDAMDRPETPPKEPTPQNPNNQETVVHTQANDQQIQDHPNEELSKIQVACKKLLDLEEQFSLPAEFKSLLNWELRNVMVEWIERFLGNGGIGYTEEKIFGVQQKIFSAILSRRYLESAERLLTRLFQRFAPAQHVDPTGIGSRQVVLIRSVEDLPTEKNFRCYT